MFFTEYGKFTGETCPYCKKSDTYLFTKKTENRAFLFFPLGTKSKKYYTRCTNCGDVHELDSDDALSIIDKNFYKKDKRDNLKNIVRCLIPYVVVIALVLGAVAIEYSSNEHAIKRALANEPDGNYYVYNENSEYLATVSIADSIMTYDMFAKYVYVNADDYDSILEDQVEISYYHEVDGKLKMCTETNSCLVMDRRNVDLRYCKYDPEVNQQYYYWGVKNYEDILYIDEDNAIYQYECWDENGENIEYKMFYKKTPNYRAELYYSQDENKQYVFNTLDVYYTENNYVVGFARYESATTDSSFIPYTKDLNVSDVITSLEENDVQPTTAYTYTLIKNTHIVKSWERVKCDGSTTNFSSSRVKKIGEYYILEINTD